MMGSFSRSRWKLFVILMVLGCCQFTDALIWESEILMEFKRRISDKRGVLEDWVSGVDPCGAVPWYGLTCSNNTDDQSQVATIELASSFLGGEISTGLCELQGLVTLDMTDNEFTGEIPPLSGCPRLNELKLGKNSFSGSFPVVFAPTVTVMEFHENSLIGNISQTQLGELILLRLDLHGNNLTGNLPGNRTWLGSLQQLDVSNNQLDGPLPPDLGNLRDLSYADLSGNRFSGPIPQGRWENIKVIDLSRNDLSGSIPSGLLGLRGRSYLNCSSNSLSGELNMTEFIENKANGSIRTLDLSNNHLEGPIPEVFSTQTKKLEFLCLHNNRFSGRTDNIFSTNLSNLRELRLGGNNLSVGNLLTLASNQNASFPRLEVMDLRGSGADGVIPPEFFRHERLPILSVLDLSTNRFEGPIPPSLVQLEKLSELRLRGNFLTGNVDWLSRTCGRLQILDLSNNHLHFSNTLVEGASDCYGLMELRLGNNAPSPMRSTLPAVLGDLEILDLSSSNYEGNISALYSSTDALPSLKYLDLSNNFLDGSISAEFGRMPLLVHLDLSNNNLSGVLPPLPPVLSKKAFFANNSLCGAPLQPCPPIIDPSPKGLAIWIIIIIVLVGVLLSGSICLVLGWIWRRRVDEKIHQQDVELIAALLDRDTTNLMSLRELRKATNDFSEEHQIGVGGFGVVYRGTLEDGSTVAIKKSRRDGSSSEDKSQFLNEVKILSQVHHRNLVRLLGCCLANKNALLVFEFISGGTLEEHLQRKGGRTPLTWDQRLQIAFQTVNALDYLHSSANPPIYHLDVKSANILLDKNLNAKVADFGISKLAPAVDATHITVMHGFQGTFGYMDPESVVSSMLTDKSDVYAFGVVLLELITAKRAMDRSRGEDVSLVKWAGSVIKSGHLEEIIDSPISHTYHTAHGKRSIEDVAKLAEQCLKFQCVERPTMRDLSKDLLIIQQRLRN